MKLIRCIRDIILCLYSAWYDWHKYGNYREMSKAEAIIILFGRRKKDD